ncbi:MAG: hypothetical protein WKF35_03675 [Ferruginibacter sp.]
MQIIKKYYNTNPGNETGSSEKLNENPDDNNKNKVENEGTTPIKNKIKDALQQWANDDARDIAEDDSTPLRSGL